jgi:hydroxyethylthiazole kinase-like uncharacterized protein yjeF
MMKVEPHQLLVRSLFEGVLSRKDEHAHKGTFGSVAIIGGDAGMVGAGLLAARAALLSGAGRVYAAMLSSEAPSVDLQFPEIMLRAPSQLVELKQLNVVVIGPGLGQTDAAVNLLVFWLQQEKPILLDADALNLISLHSHLREMTQNRSTVTVITPHPGEAARLLNTTISHVEKNRIECAVNLAQTFKAVCVLKGAGTVCADYEGEFFINTSGNNGLASGGTGDVLSGVIGSLMAQAISGLEAAKLGVFAHGIAADALVASGIGPIGLTASEVAHEIRNVLNQFNSES